MRDQKLPSTRHGGWTQTKGRDVMSADETGIPAQTNQVPWRHSNRIDNCRHHPSTANRREVSVFRHVGVIGLREKWKK